MSSVYKHKILLTALVVSKYCYAQNAFQEMPQAEEATLKIASAERVGAVPLPGSHNSGMQAMPSAQFQFDGIKSDPDTKKGSFQSTYLPGRMVYLNGENIGSIREQELENVNVKIDRNGNLYIEAPQYEVASEHSYHPLFPKELPAFQKEKGYELSAFPQGTYSKQTSGVATPDKKIEESVAPASSPQKVIEPEMTKPQTK